MWRSDILSKDAGPFDDFNWDIFFGKILFFMAGQYVGENVSF